MAEVAKPFNDDDLLTEKISKKDIVTFLQEYASSQVSGVLLVVLRLVTFILMDGKCFLIHNLITVSTFAMLVSVVAITCRPDCFLSTAFSLPRANDSHQQRVASLAEHFLPYTGCILQSVLVAIA